MMDARPWRPAAARRPDLRGVHRYRSRRCRNVPSTRETVKEANRFQGQLSVLAQLVGPDQASTSCLGRAAKAAAPPQRESLLFLFVGFCCSSATIVLSREILVCSARWFLPPSFHFLHCSICFPGSVCLGADGAPCRICAGVV